MQNAGNPYADNRTELVVTIPSGQSVSGSVLLNDTALLGLIMSAAWTAAALTIEVSADDVVYSGLAYDDTGAQCNSIASPTAGSAHALNIAGLLPYQYIRLRSGTTAAPVNQAAERSITVITRPLS